MSRQVRRVPEDFSWPLNKVWEGFTLPKGLYSDSCPDCDLGYSDEGEFFHDQWYGKVPFDPSSMGSNPFLADGPEARAWAERQLSQSPEYYGTGEAALQREAERIVQLWNGSWSHHLSQADVDALIAEERLWDFTRDFIPGTGWIEKKNLTMPTAAEVNSWSLFGLGHDGINSGVCIRARAEREGVPLLCSTCNGSASMESYPGQAAEADAWEPTDPPEGEGWQLWEGVSEGSPITPVFATAEELATYLSLNYRKCFNRNGSESVEDLLHWVTDSGWTPSLMTRSER